MYLEETGLPYTLKPVNISRGDQFAPEFLAIAPNNRIPAIVDHAPAIAGGPLSLFESGAILLYLADKTGTADSRAMRARAGNASSGCSGRWRASARWPARTTISAATRSSPFPTRSTATSTKRGGSMRCSTGNCAAANSSRGDYSIADIACYPWVQPERQRQNIDDFPDLKRWKAAIAARPATQRAYAIAKTVNAKPAVSDEESRRILFGQTRHTVQG